MRILSRHLRSLALATLAVLVSAHGTVKAAEPPSVEVFTASDMPIDTGLEAGRVDVYAIDGIERFEAELSRELPDGPDAARRIIQERIARLDKAQMQRVQRAALGLSKAMQYGVDRYPAIVFDGRAVVYGVSDVEVALHRYRWRREVSAE